MRFLMFLTVLFITFPVMPSNADESKLLPGDKGFRHKQMHPFYQKLFAKGKCACHTGECRPTIYRSSSTSPSGVQVVLNRVWIDVPKAAIQEKMSVPPELWVDPAHICAFEDRDEGMRKKHIKVECAIINSGV